MKVCPKNRACIAVGTDNIHFKEHFLKVFSSFEARDSTCIYGRLNNFTFCFLLDPINYNQDQFADQTVSIIDWNCNYQVIWFMWNNGKGDMSF